MQEKLVEQAKKGEACCPNIDGKTRFIGFVITVIIGLVLSLISIGSVFNIIFDGLSSKKSGTSWSAALLTLGNCFCIASTFFLYGPKNQCAKMIEPVRIVASFVLIIAFIFTLICTFAIQKQWLTAIAIIAQFIALIWYVFSYIPFAQECLTKCTRKICCGCCMKGEETGGEPATVA